MLLEEAKEILKKNGYDLSKKLCYTIIHCTVKYMNDGDWAGGYWFNGEDLDKKEPTKYNLEDILQQLADEIKDNDFVNPKKWNVISYNEATGILEINTDFIKDKKTVRYDVTIKCDVKSLPTMNEISKIIDSLGFNK